MIWKAAAYCRLSREDGDKAESDSIANQQNLLRHYISSQTDLDLTDIYSDDGYTGTNFDRPDFQRMMADIEAGRITCVTVKDLSRFGRDYIDVGRYLERIFPSLGVRFIAISDHVDSKKGSYDMMLPLKNVFNEQYARDISQKVKASLKAKQRSGQFIGAFASYGYLKDPVDKNRLVVDPVAAVTVRRIFDLYEGGMGKIAIAKKLNQEDIPCPSVYKEQMGEKYHNGQRIRNTTYWTYATIHRMLKSQIYAGHMEQGRNQRPTMHGKAKQLDKSQWIVVENTHEPIIDEAQWNRVQFLLTKDTRTANFKQNVSPFAGFLRCGDCGRAMSKSARSGTISYSCGSYKRYGAGVCSAHTIRHDELEKLVLEDINALIAMAENLAVIAQAVAKDTEKKRDHTAEGERLITALRRIHNLKKRSYEDYAEGLLSKSDYLRLKEDYDRQETQLEGQRKQIEQRQEEPLLMERAWVKGLLEHGKLTSLDRPTLAELVDRIELFEDGKVQISYKIAIPEGML